MCVCVCVWERERERERENRASPRKSPRPPLHLKNGANMPLTTRKPRPVKSASSGSDWEETIQHPNWGTLSQTTGLYLQKKKKKKKQYQKETYQNMYWQWCREIGILYIAGGNVKWCSYCGKSLVASRKIKHKITLRPGSCTPGSIPKRTANRRYSNKNLYMDIHGNTIHSSQKVETTHMSISRWMDKLIGFHPYSGVLLGLKR